MAAGMDPVDALRVKTLIEKSGTPWQFLHFVGTHRSLRINVQNRDTGKLKIVSSEKKWNRLASGVES